MNVQIIEKTRKTRMGCYSFQRLQKASRSAGRCRRYKRIEENLRDIQEGKEITVPGEVTFAILDGISPIRAWREHKQIKMNELSKKVGISSAYLSQIENGKRNPTIDTLKAIAKELEIDIEMLI